MKFNFRLLCFLIFSSIILLIPQHINAQELDTLIVEWENSEQHINTLYDAIVRDTLPDGSHPQNRVYKLRAGGYYWNTETIFSDFPLRIIGEEPGNTHETHPAVLQMVLDQDSASHPGRMIECSNSLTLKNLYIIGSDNKGKQKYYYQPIQVNAIGKRFVIDSCIFERSDYAIIGWAGGQDNSIFITNCIFRNLIENPVTLQWTGRGFSVWTDADSVVVENNTFFNVNMCAMQIENGAANYVRFNHNTLVNVGRAITSPYNVWWKTAYFANLLLVNVFWHGEAACDYDPVFNLNRTTYNTGMFPILPMPARYGTDLGRRIFFTHTAAYLDSYFKTQYADSIRIQPYINSVTDSFFTTFSPVNSGQMIICDTTWLVFKPTFDSDPNTPEQLQNMYNSITGSRAYQYYGSSTPASTYFYDLQIDPVAGDTLWTEPTWPLPENFHYPENLKGTDGLPLGDLNWFPDKQEIFEENKEQFIYELEHGIDFPPPPPVFYSFDSEDGILGGTAEVKRFTGDSWYTLTGGSSIKWTFSSTYSYPLDMVIKARPDGENIGFDFILNNNPIVDAARGWGQFVFWTGLDSPQTFWTGKSPDQFYEATYMNSEITPSADFKSKTGENTLKLEYSWNNASFGKIDLYQEGTSNLVASLIPADAENTGAVPGGTGVWVPRGFKYVALNSGGSITWDNLNFWYTYGYKIWLFYQNYSFPQTIQIELDDSLVSEIELDANPDSVGLDGVSNLFKVTAGQHSLTLRGSGANIDWIEIIPSGPFPFVKTEDNELPRTFSLSQNYPNPFNPTTIINFSVPKTELVSVKLYDVLGKEVTELVNEELNPGNYSTTLDGSGLASGVYFYTIMAGNFYQVKKMILLR